MIRMLKDFYKKFKNGRVFDKNCSDSQLTKYENKFTPGNDYLVPVHKVGSLSHIVQIRGVHSPKN